MKYLAWAFLLATSMPLAAQVPIDVSATLARAQAGDADAQFTIAEAYRSGRDIPPDPETAIMWYRRAAAQGHVRASEELGFALFAHGDRREAMPYIEKAAARGEARAFYLLGTAHFNGDYASRDWPLAYAQTTRAASAGLPAAQRNLEMMERYLLPADRAKADELLATLPPVRANPAKAMVVAAGPIPQRVSASPVKAPSLEPATRPAKTTKPAVTPLAATPASPEMARGDWKVQLGAFGSAERARDRWKTLSSKVSRLGNYQQHIVPAGSIQRLQAASISTKADAQSLCMEVKATGGDCLVIKP